MVFAASLGVMAVATLMLWGWGCAFQKLFKLESSAWPATAALGMAVVVFLGGVLNLARLAYPWMLAVIAAGGVFLALREGISFSPPRLPVAILVAIVTIFTLATQLPPGMYNGHDDFQKYFAYPVRMLQTGTVFGSPLGAMGTQTLGAQAFLDAFVIALFPIVYINGLDAVFGLFLSMMMASRFGGRLATTLPCVLSVIFIEPQYANVSTLYSGSALIMATAAFSAPSVLGLLYAALLAMKPTFAIFVAIHLLAMSAVRGIRWALLAGLATLGFLLPWLLLHGPHYVAGLRAKIVNPSPIPGAVAQDSFHLLSFAPLEYGASAASYTLLIVAIGICGVMCFRDKRTLVVSACAIATLFVLIYSLGPLHAGYEQSLRYFSPVAIGLTPPIFGWAGRRRWLPLIAAAIGLAAFAPSLAMRVEWASKVHSIWSYAWTTADADYLEYNARVLKGSEQDTVQTLQARIPAGETILAWINTPFYLNYKRNRIVDIDPAGIGNPWATVPQANYLIWDYDGFATRDPDWYRRQALDVGAGERRNSALSLDFLHRLETMSANGEIIYDNGEIKIVRLKDGGRM